MRGMMRWWMPLLIAVGAGTALNFASAQMVIDEGFENGLEAWTVGTDLPDDPNMEGKVAAEVTIQEETVFAGAKSARLYIDGRQDDGTIWIARQVDASMADEVSLSFRFWSPFKGSFNNLAYVVAYVGPAQPQREADLPRLAPVTDVGEWDKLQVSAPTHGAESLWVAVGFSVVWESEQEYFLDEVAVELLQVDAPTGVDSRSWSGVKKAVTQ